VSIEILLYSGPEVETKAAHPSGEVSTDALFAAIHQFSHFFHGEIGQIAKYDCLSLALG